MHCDCEKKETDDEFHWRMCPGYTKHLTTPDNNEKNKRYTIKTPQNTSNKSKNDSKDIIKWAYYHLVQNQAENNSDPGNRTPRQPPHL